MSSFNGVPVPPEKGADRLCQRQVRVPDNPTIPYIEGDGTGRDISGIAPGL